MKESVGKLLGFLREALRRVKSLAGKAVRVITGIAGRGKSAAGSSMEARMGKLLDFLRGAEQITIPIFQRPYCWTENECKQLWDDLIDAGGNNRAHFFGAVVLLRQREGIFRVIDGQQRLITVSLLLKSLENYLGEAGGESGFSAGIDGLPGFNNAQGLRRYQISPTMTDASALRAVATRTVGENDGESLIVDNFNCFENWLNAEDLSEDTLAALRRGLGKLKAAFIEIGTNDDPQRIFESLNAKGVALEQIDLIRNFILMNLDAEQQDRCYEQYWLRMEEKFKQFGKWGQWHLQNFMRHYLRMFAGVEKDREIYDVMKSCAGKYFPIDEGLLKDIYDFSRYYWAMEHQESPEPFAEAFADFRRVERYDAHPLLFKMCHSHENKNLPAEDFKMAIRLIESYLIRRSICGGRMVSGLKEIFADFIDFETIPPEHYLGAIQDRFLSLRGAYEFPSDDAFKGVLRTLNDTGWAKWLLLCLESQLPGDENNIDVDHIMPQTPDDGWTPEFRERWNEVRDKGLLHTPGNLTLLAQGDNRGSSNNPPGEKREVYANSAFQLTNDLATPDLENWDAVRIRNRGAELADAIVEKLWPAYPGKEPQALEKLEAYRAWKNAGN